ncbi:MAG TPA: hypothetical protein VGO81_05105 [Solirubrobacteraceae bacterium]|nr:hypothetical protein [Solirubrobacteraceae bacterium]
MDPAAPPVTPTYRGVLRAPRLLVYLAAGLSLLAGYVHFAYAESHFEEWWGYGAFFVAAGNLQALFAALIVWRPRAWQPLAGIAGNLAIVVVYLLSRTSGIPLGPHARVVEAAGAIDWATTAGQVALIGALIAMLDGRGRRRIIDGLMLLGVLAWVLRLSGHLQ